MSLLWVVIIIIVVLALAGGGWGQAHYGYWGWSPLGLILREGSKKAPDFNPGMNCDGKK